MNSLACHLAYPHIEHRIEELLALLKKSLLKNGTTKEACLAARAIALTFVNLDQASDTEADDLYRRILPSLRTIIKDSDQVDIKTSVSLQRFFFSFYYHLYITFYDE